MKKQSIIIGGVIVLLVVGGVLLWWFSQTKPTSGEIESSTKSIKKVDANIMNNKTTKEIENRKIIGNIPVEVNSNYDHTNLFE